MEMEWISVKNKTPEEGKDVLVSDGFPKYEIAAYRTFNNGQFFVCGSYTLSGVTHWMPLPKPPEEK